MTFRDEVTRLTFHRLPTDVQVAYSDFEQRLAQRGQQIFIDGVRLDENVSEVIIRISEDYRNAAARTGSATA